MTLLEMSAVLEANHGPTIYDRTFSNPEAEQPSYEDFEAIVANVVSAQKFSRVRTPARPAGIFVMPLEA